MGIHESQSLFFEMQMARHPAFMARLSPLVSQSFGAQPAFSNESLARIYTRVMATSGSMPMGVTYPAHILLRYEIEQKLIEGNIRLPIFPSCGICG